MTNINTITGLTGTSVGRRPKPAARPSGNVSERDSAIQPSQSNGSDIHRANPDQGYHQNEWGAFFKDDWKIRPNLTLNVGVRYDFYGVPWEKNGMHALPVGGSEGLFGISGTSFADMWQPGRLAGSLTEASACRQELQPSGHAVLQQ